MVQTKTNHVLGGGKAQAAGKAQNYRKTQVSRDRSISKAENCLEASRQWHRLPALFRPT